MSHRPLRLVPLFALGALAIVAACSPSHDDSGTVVIGLQADDLGGALGSVHVVAKVDGQVARDETIRVTPGAPSPFPHEIPLTAPSGHPDAPIDVAVDGYASGAPPGMPPILTRLASTHFVPGDKRLLRLRLDPRCITGLVGGLGGPVCTAPQTCVGGSCADDAVATKDLETYRANWASDDAGDACRPPNHGPPEVIVGTGQTDYLPVTDGQTLQAELGPQGGHHIWIAVRMHNLKQSGSTTTITAVQPGTGAQVQPSSSVFTFDPDEGGYCKLYGMRFQLDAGGVDYKQFLGTPLDVTVEVRDSTGAVGKGTAHIVVDTKVIGE